MHKQGQELRTGIIREQKISVKIFSNKSLQFLLLLFITVFFRKTLPPFLFSGFLFFTLLWFYHSKNDWFFILYAFVLNYDVGGIIGFGGYRIISTGPFILMYFDLFSIIAFIKTFGRKANYKLLKRPLNIWLFYGAGLLLFGLAIYGFTDFGGHTGLRYFWYLFRLIISLLLLFSIVRMINNFNDIIKISEILFLLVFINFAGQLFYLNTGRPIFYYITGVTVGESSFLSTLGENVFQVAGTMRPEYGAILRFIALFLSMYFYYRKNSVFKKSYLLIVIFTILISTFITATRGWILSFSFFLLLSLTLTKKGTRYLKVFLWGILFFIVMVTFIKPVQFQVLKAFDRLTTLELLVEGDVTAGGTNRRLTDRSEPVMSLFYEHPTFGVGISGLGMKTSDSHVGNQTILMGEGIVGMMIFIYFILGTILNLWKINNKLAKFNKNYDGNILFNYAFGI